jgi:hypothetical protein
VDNVDVDVVVDVGVTSWYVNDVTTEGAGVSVKSIGTAIGVVDTVVELQVVTGRSTLKQVIISLGCFFTRRFFFGLDSFESSAFLFL